MDDQSFAPIAPSLEQEPEVVENDLIQEDKETAQAFYHPAWVKVFEIFENELESLSQPTSNALIAEEYKIEDMSKKKAIAVINRVIGRVKDAVEATESIERKPTGKGGK